MSPELRLTNKQRSTILARLKTVLSEPLPEEDKTPVLDSVRLAHARRDTLLKIAKTFGTPCFVLSEADLVERARKFCGAFSRAGLRAQVFYAYKANELPWLCRRLHREGIGAEVVSGMELQLALKLGCKQILFNGPAKSDEELRLAARHADRVWLHIDHEYELTRIRRLRLPLRRPLRAAVRIDPGPKIGGTWRKFGVSPPASVRLIRQIMATHGLQWEGLHGHLSWNTSPEPYRELIRIFARVLKSLSPRERACLQYIDLGGGIYPRGEGNRLSDSSFGQLVLAAESEAGRRLMHRREFFPKMADVSEYADVIAEEVKRNLTTIPGVRPDLLVRFEPGRWMVSNTVGILTTVVTQKKRDIVIVDGGIHLTHDHRMQEEYHALVNLSRPGKTIRERACQVFGPMCDPNDRWGEACWGEMPVPGDRLWIANMGAYSSSSAMRFLFPLAPYVLIAEDGATRKLTDRESFDRRYPREWF